MLEWINRYMIGLCVPVLLVTAGIFIGFRLRWFHVLHPLRTVRHALGKNMGDAFSSLCLALAGTLGVGNIVGVAAAIATGGCGAVFWMWVSAFFAMILKYSEIVVAMRHTRINSAGEGHGSAMICIEDRLGKAGFGRYVAVIFAVFLVINALSMGSFIQAEAVTSAFDSVFGVPKVICALLLAVATLMVVLFGRVGIMKLTDRLVPFMSLGFVILSVAAIAIRLDRVPEALVSIFTEAFSIEAGVGGVLGFFLSKGLRFGVMRGLISNEAGCGTSPMAHAANCGTPPYKQGIWGIFEVFVDTIVLCTLTALVIVVSGIPLEGEGYMMMTIGAYSEILGSWSAVPMAVAVLFFGFATIICWSHYGREGMEYILPRKGSGAVFLALYILSVLMSGFCSVGGAWQLADLSIGAMTVINLCMLFLMRREIYEESRFLTR